MSTRVRYLFVNHGTGYNGRRIWAVLVKLNIHQALSIPGRAEIIPPPSLSKWQKVLYIYEHLPPDETCQLMIFREPRNLPEKFSRYIKACQHYGVGHRIFSPRLQQAERITNNGHPDIRPAGPRRGNHGGANIPARTNTRVAPPPQPVPQGAPPMPAPNNAPNFQQPEGATFGGQTLNATGAWTWSTNPWR